MKLRISPLSFAYAFLVMSTLLAAAPVNAAENVKTTGTKSVTVPFRLVEGHVFVDAVVNGKPAVLVVDTGAGADIVRPESMARLGIVVPKQKSAAEAKGGGGSQSAKMVEISSITLGDISISNDTAFAVSLPPVLECDGLLGYSFLSRYVTTFDYAHKTLTICEPAAFTPPASTSLPITMSSNIPAVTANIDGISGLFQLDTGGGEGLTLTTPFVDHKRLRDRYPRRIETITGMGIGGPIRSALVRLGEFTIGSAVVKGAIAELSLQKQGAFADSGFDGSVGSEILSRFTLTLDYPGRQAYFIPNTALNDLFTYNRSGIGIILDGERVTVGDVVPNSAAAKTGVKVGDEIVSANGAPVNARTLDSLHSLVRRDAGTSFTMAVLHHGETIPEDVTLTLSDLL